MRCLDCLEGCRSHCEKEREQEERKCPFAAVWKLALVIGVIYAVCRTVNKHYGGICKKCRKAVCHPSSERLEEE